MLDDIEEKENEGISHEEQAEERAIITSNGSGKNDNIPGITVIKEESGTKYSAELKP